MREQILFFAVLASTVAFGQSVPSQSSSSSKGLELLAQVCRRYGDAKSYYIESVEERTSVREFSRSWEKTILIAAASPENRYHYEGRSGVSDSLRVSDGQTIWTYHGADHRYTAKSKSAASSEKSQVIPMTEYALHQAQDLREQLSGLVKSMKSAEVLPDATLRINGQKVSCHVIRLRSADQKRPSAGYSFEKTIWIDKQQLTILRIVEHARASLLVEGSVGIPMDEDSVTTFHNTDLEGPIAENFFRFVPPPEAKRIDDFPDPRHFGGGMVGEQLSSLKLKTPAGQVESLDSFHGKPVLIDLWATWCASCVAELPKFDKIYHEAAGKGLVLISIDWDEEAKTASDFLSKKGYTWPNFHDEGDIEKIVGSSPVPRALLIDAQGKVVFDQTGMDEDALRAQIAKLGPEYASMAPRKQSTCPAAE